MNTFLAPALRYAEEGEEVLPVFGTDEAGVCRCPAGKGCQNKPGKHPIGKLVPDGVHDASSDPEVINSWAQWCKNANIGRATARHPVIDIDLPEVARELAEDVALRADTLLIRTPRAGGGLHIVLATSQPVKGRKLYLADGTVLGDLKGEGGYVLVPPSRIGDRAYERLSPEEVQPLRVDDPVAWLRKLLPAFGYELREKRPDGEQDFQALGAVIHEGARHDAMKSYAGKVWVDGISSETFIELLQTINRAQCRPPLPDEELESIAHWFIDTKERRALTVNTSGVSPDGEIDEEGLLAALDAPATKPSANGATPEPATPWLPLALPDGHYISRYVRYAQARTDAPPEYHEALAVAQLSAAVGRGPRIPLASKPDGMRCNVQALLLGDSSISRKSTSEELTIDLLRVVDDGMFLANDSSPQGFVQEMSMRDGGTSLWYRDEFRAFLAQLLKSGWMAGGKELLMKMFDGSAYHRRLRAKMKKGQPVADEEYVREPHLVVIAAGVTARIIDVLTVDDVLDGFMPRFLVANPQTLPTRRPAGTITPEIEAERRGLIATLNNIYSGYGERGALSVQFDDGVLDRWNEYAAKIEKAAAASPNADIFGPIAVRIADYALKVGALFQAADGVPSEGSNLHLSMPMLEAAIEFCERRRRDAEMLATEIGSGAGERKLARFIKMVLHHPGIARGEVARSLKVDKKDLDSLEATALDRELITISNRNTRGRTAKCYFPNH